MSWCCEVKQEGRTLEAEHTELSGTGFFDSVCSLVRDYCTCVYGMELAVQVRSVGDSVSLGLSMTYHGYGIHPQHCLRACEVEQCFASIVLRSERWTAGRLVDRSFVGLAVACLVC